MRRWRQQITLSKVERFKQPINWADEAANFLRGKTLSLMNRRRRRLEKVRQAAILRGEEEAQRLADKDEWNG